MKELVANALVKARIALVTALACGGNLACSPASGPPGHPAEEPVAVGSGISGSLPVGTKLRASANVNLRTGPSTSSEILTVVAKGSTVELLLSEPTEGFYEVRRDAITGWTSGKYYSVVASDSATGGWSAAVWTPPPGTSWQWQLSGSVDTSVNVAVYDIDLFDTSAATIAALRANGRRVICYFSAGSREDWRPDASDFSSADHGNALDGWAGETWLDTRSANVRAVMGKRLDLAVAKGCDGVEPDNVDAYANDSGFALTAATQREYDGWLAAEAHARGLSVGLKNAVELVNELVGSFDWALDEECFQYGECEGLEPFISANKAVFHVEYAASSAEALAKKSSVCGHPSTSGFSTLIKRLDLDAWRLACD